MANKINEIVDVLNNGDTVAGITARVENLEDGLSTVTTNTQQNTEDIEQMDYHLDEVASLTDSNARKINVLEGRADYAQRNIENLIEKTNNLEQWEVTTDESDIFETIDGHKYFKHDTYLVYNGIYKGIEEYFIKGYPKDRIMIKSFFIDSSNENSFDFVFNRLRVIDDVFKLSDESSVFDFSQTPPRTSHSVDVYDLEYGESYDDTGVYGKILMFVRADS